MSRLPVQGTHSCSRPPRAALLALLVASCLVGALAQLVPANLYPVLTPVSRADPQYIVGFLSKDFDRARADALLPPQNYGASPLTVPVRIERQDFTCAVPLRTPFGSQRSASGAAAASAAGFVFPVPALSARPIAQTFQRYAEPAAAAAEDAAAAAASAAAGGTAAPAASATALPAVPPLDALLSPHPAALAHWRALAAQGTDPAFVSAYGAASPAADAASAASSAPAAPGDELVLGARVPAARRAELLATALQGLCVEHDHGYWSYAVCPFANVTQFRRAQGSASGAAAPHETTFLLGQYAASSADETAPLPAAFAALSRIPGVRGEGVAARAWADLAAEAKAAEAATTAAAAANPAGSDSSANAASASASATTTVSPALAAAEAAAAARAAALSSRPADFLHRWVRDLLADVGAPDHALTANDAANAAANAGAGDPGAEGDADGLRRGAAEMLEALGFDSDVIIGAAGADGTVPLDALPAGGDGDGDGVSLMARELAALGLGALDDDALRRLRETAADIVAESMERGAEAGDAVVDVDIVGVVEDAAHELGLTLAPADASQLQAEQAQSQLSDSASATETTPAPAATATKPAPAAASTAAAATPAAPAVSLPAGPRTIATEGVYAQFFSGGTSHRNTRVLFVCPSAAMQRPRLRPQGPAVALRPPRPAIEAAATAIAAAAEERQAADAAAAAVAAETDTQQASEAAAADDSESDAGAELDDEGDDESEGEVDMSKVRGTTYATDSEGNLLRASAKDKTASKAGSSKDSKQGKDSGKQGKVRSALDNNDVKKGSTASTATAPTTASPAASDPKSKSDSKSQSDSKSKSSSKAGKSAVSAAGWEAWIAHISEPRPHDYVITVATDAACALAALAAAPEAEREALVRPATATAAKPASTAAVSGGRAPRLPVAGAGAADAASAEPAGPLQLLEAGRALSSVAAVGCLTHNAGWWTYTLCPGRDIVQYHVHVETTGPGKGQAATTAAGGNKPQTTFQTTASYGLGAVPSGPLPVAASAAAAVAAVAAAGPVARDPAAAAWARSLAVVKAGKWSDNYIAQWYEGGAACDDGTPRRTEARFFCPPSGKTRGPASIVAVTEVAACQYVIEVDAPQLCALGVMRPEQLVFGELVCRVDDNAFGDAATVGAANTDSDLLGMASRAVPTEAALEMLSEEPVRADPAAAFSSSLLASARATPRSRTLAIDRDTRPDPALAALIRGLWGEAST